MLHSYYQKLVMSHLLVLFLTISIMAGFNYAFSRDQQSQRMLEMLGYSGQQTARQHRSAICADAERQRDGGATHCSRRCAIRWAKPRSRRPTPTPSRPSRRSGTRSTSRTSPLGCRPASFHRARASRFFSINQPGGRPMRREVLEAPYNKLCWMALTGLRLSLHALFQLPALQPDHLLHAGQHAERLGLLLLFSSTSTNRNWRRCSTNPRRPRSCSTSWMIRGGFSRTRTAPGWGMNYRPG